MPTQILVAEKQSLIGRRRSIGTLAVSRSDDERGLATALNWYEDGSLTIQSPLTSNLDRAVSPERLTGVEKERVLERLASLFALAVIVQNQ